MADSVKVGDKVTTTAETDVNGTHLASFVRETTYEVIQVGGSGLPDSRIVIGLNGAVTAAVDISTLTVVNASTSTKSGGKSDPVDRYKDKDNVLSSKGIESGLKKLLKESLPTDIFKYSMRLFGIPHQFTHYCDYRTYSVSKKSKDELIGRTFAENIMFEAPAITIIPGKPLYLPAAKNKQGISYGLMSAVNSDASVLFEALKNEKLYDKLRYYDFQQDYIEYIKYVNVMCAVAAALLDLGNETIDGEPLTTYDWKNYRWTAQNYAYASSQVWAASKKAMSNMVDNLKTYGKAFLNMLGVGKTPSKKSTVKAFEDNDDDKTLTEAMEEMLTQMNFVQFYVDASSGLSESAENGTTSSQLEGIFNAAEDMTKEIAFIGNSGGLSDNDFTNAVKEGADAMNEKIASTFNGTIGGIIQRLSSNVTNVIKGEKMIFPEIYQNSKYTKSYSITIDLRAPYGNKYSYFMNVLVPLFHLIALTVPKQSTANTYGSPFLVKAYYPGVFACNLGIVKSIQIDKNPSGDAWTIDGFPNEMKVTLNIDDLYSDLTISPSGDIVKFLANSSLIEYIATNCGVNLTTPQLQNRVKQVTTVVKQSISTMVEDTVNMATRREKFENWVASIVGV